MYIAGALISISCLSWRSRFLFSPYISFHCVDSIKFLLFMLLIDIPQNGFTRFHIEKSTLILIILYGCLENVLRRDRNTLWNGRWILWKWHAQLLSRISFHWMHDENNEKAKSKKKRKLGFDEAKRTKARILSENGNNEIWLFAWRNIHLIEHLKARATIYDSKMVGKMSTALECFSTSITR